MIRKFILPALAVVGLLLGFRVVRASNVPVPTAQAVVEPRRAPFKARVAGAGIIESSSENIAIAAERVAVDLMSLTSAVAVALNRSIKGKEAKDADPEIVKLWCQFYCEELLPQTKAMVKRTSPKLDAFGLFLPTRMSASVSQEVLKTGLHGGVTDTNENETDAAINAENGANTVKALESEKESKITTEGSEGEKGGEKQADEQLEEDVKQGEAEEDEEYEYEEEYYDE